MNKDSGNQRANQELHGAGVTPCALPEGKSLEGTDFVQKGVSTHCALNSAINNVSAFKITPPLPSIGMRLGLPTAVRKQLTTILYQKEWKHSAPCRK